MATTDETHKDGASPGSLLLGVSNEMVRLYKDHFGRGPTVVRSFWCGNDTITCVLEQTLTRAEQHMVRMGEHQRLRDVRMLLQSASVREFCEPVERLTGRKVRAFTSGIDPQADGLCVETFILHPQGSDARSRAG